MDLLNTKDKVCIASLKLLGDYWTLRIINALSDSELRYCELQRDVGRLNPTTFTSRLKKLEEAKIIARQEKSPGHVNYALTRVGRETLPVLEALNSFSAKTQSLN